MEFSISSAPGASVGSTVAFKNETDQGAVLITEPPIRHYKAQHETLFLDWMVANTTKLLSNCSDIAKYGVWIVTKTYSTTQCARAVLSSRNAEVTIAVDADVADVATASPSVSWWKRGSDSSWNIQNDVCHVPTCSVSLLPTYLTGSGYSTPVSWCL